MLGRVGGCGLVGVVVARVMCLTWFDCGDGMGGVMLVFCKGDGEFEGMDGFRLFGKYSTVKVLACPAGSRFIHAYAE